MLLPLDEYFRLERLMRKARRRGDAAAAERWMKLAERQIRAVERLNKIINDVRTEEITRRCERRAAERRRQRGY